MLKMKRVKTYIEGFDELIEGGFVENSSNLIYAKAGCGKTIFSLEYLVNGAMKDNEVGVYFSFEEKKESLINQAKQFGWDLVKLEKAKKLRIVSLGLDDISSRTVEDLIEIITDLKAKRVVVDSLPTLAYLLVNAETNTDLQIRKFILQFIAELSQINTTCLLIGQEDDNLTTTISKYSCDGVIHLEFESLGGDYSRTLTIPKMRKTKNNEDVHSVEINNSGVIVHSLE